ncbi:DUF1108 family protein [Staphylococcus aureus]
MYYKIGDVCQKVINVGMSTFF